LHGGRERKRISRLKLLDKNESLFLPKWLIRGPAISAISSRLFQHPICPKNSMETERGLFSAR
jgi:hypothetical protein